ncbi:MAG: alanine racemase [Candidatus Omnitrophica bacterium]|nr:alanine racemase [Candidatus Omnitrophota bacterium]
MKNITYRPTWAEINLKNLEFNYRQLKRAAGQKIKVLAAVKANAYGHGILEVSRKLESAGVDYLGVASIDEALFLRRGKIMAPILVLGVAFSENEMRLAVKFNITLTVADYQYAKILNSHASEKNKIKIHIKVDTGMGRLGIWHEQAKAQIIKISRLKNLSIEGVYTHLPSADTDIVFTRTQVRIFESLIKELRQNKIPVKLAHAANSIAACRFPGSCLNMIRPGIMLYGIYPDKKLKSSIKLKQVLSLKTKITYLKTVDAGRSISYGRTYITWHKTRIATLPLGYADGYSRALSNKAKVIIRGKKFPVIGRVCMDQTMIDVGIGSKIKKGDIVTLIGSQGAKAIHAEDLSFICNTIAYEIICWISSRVPRVFKNH